METIKKLFVLVLLLAAYTPAHGEILIYQKSVKGYDCNSIDDVWDVAQRKHKGYLVLEVEYDYVEDVKVINVLNAKQIDYFREGRDDKWYEVEEHEFEVVRANYDGKLMWFITGTVVDQYIGIELLMLQGLVVDTNIGLENNVPREVPKKLLGNFLNDQQLSISHFIDTWEIKLRLNSRWTKNANNPNGNDGDFNNAVTDIEVVLADKGYEDRT